MSRGENIFQRRDGRWEARWIKSRDPDGSIHYGYSYGKTYRQAKENAEQAKIEQALSARENRCGILFQELCKTWLESKSIQVKESTLEKYEQILSRYLIPGFGTMDLCQIDQSKTDSFTSLLMNTKKLAAKTVKDILVILKSILKYGKQLYHLSLPEFEFTWPRQPKKEMRVLTVSEQKVLQDYLDPVHNRSHLGILIALHTGMRLGEICALQWKHVLLDEEVISVQSTLIRLKAKSGPKKTALVLTEPKSSQSMRLVPITRTLKNVLEQYQSDPEQFVLTGADYWIDPRTLQNHFEQTAKACGLKDVHFHVLRHTFATRCVEAGFDIKCLSEILGHSSVKTTLDRYVHTSMEFKKNNMKKLESVCFS